MRPRTASAIAVGLLLAACGGSSSPAGSALVGVDDATGDVLVTSSSGPTPPAPGSPSPAHIVDGVVTLSTRDNGSFLSVPRGSRVVVNLPSTSTTPAYAWSDVRSGDPAVLIPVGGSQHSAGGGVTATFTAAPGRASITASSDPSCVHTVPPCMVPAMLWTVTVDVP
jgi:hypothetical protein